MFVESGANNTLFAGTQNVKDGVYQSFVADILRLFEIYIAKRRGSPVLDPSLQSKTPESPTTPATDASNIAVSESIDSFTSPGSAPGTKTAGSNGKVKKKVAKSTGSALAATPTSASSTISASSVMHDEDFEVVTTETPPSMPLQATSDTESNADLFSMLAATTTVIVDTTSALTLGMKNMAFSIYPGYDPNELTSAKIKFAESLLEAASKKLNRQSPNKMQILASLTELIVFMSLQQAEAVKLKGKFPGSKDARLESSLNVNFEALHWLMSGVVKTDQKTLSVLEIMSFIISLEEMIEQTQKNNTPDPDLDTKLFCIQMFKAALRIKLDGLCSGEPALLHGALIPKVNGEQIVAAIIALIDFYQNVASKVDKPEDRSTAVATMTTALRAEINKQRQIVEGVWTQNSNPAIRELLGIIDSFAAKRRSAPCPD